jgi:amino-acid N-acetyltransferase
MLIQYGMSATPILVRAATADDIAAVEALLNAAALPIEGVAALIRQVPGAFVVAERQRAVVAAGALEPAGEHALLRSVVVAATARSSGVGRLVVERLLADADRRGVAGVYLLTTTAERWFPRFGFAPVNRASVPVPVANTWEFKTGCAQTAIAMARPGGTRGPEPA